MTFFKEAEKLKVKLEKEKFLVTLKQISPYHIKISLEKKLEKLGFLNLWYSPKKEKISLTYNNLLLTSLIPDLKAITGYGDEEKIEKQSKSFDGLHIFVDGSYRKGWIYYGFIALFDEKIIEKQKGSLQATKEITQRNVAGEIKAVEMAVVWADSHKYKEIFIHYDYLGLEKWAKKEWKANISLTQKYQEFFQKFILKINWVKVKSHSGNKYNEMIDQFIVSDEIL